MTLTFLSSFCLELDDDELRLVRDLFFSGYNKNVRPAQDKELPIEVKFGIAYTQIVDLVNSLLTCRSFLSDTQSYIVFFLPQIFWTYNPGQNILGHF